MSFFLLLNMKIFFFFLKNIGITKHLTDPIDYPHCLKYLLLCSVEEIHTGLVQLEGGYILTDFFHFG